MSTQNISAATPLDTLLKKNYASLSKQQLLQIEKYYKLAQTINDRAVVNKINIFNAHHLADEKQYDKSVLLLLSVLERTDGLTFDDSVKISTTLRQNYVALNNLPRAYEFQEALEKLIKQAPHKFNYLYLPRRSGLFNLFSMYKEAIRWHLQEIKSVPSLRKDNYFLASYYNNLGVYWNRAENADSSLFYFHKARYYAERIESSYDKKMKFFFIGLVDGNIGQALMLKNKYEEAIPFLKKDIASSYWSNQNDNAAVSQAELAQCLFELGYLDNAEIQLQKSFEFITLKDNPQQYIKSLRLYSSILEKQHKTQKYIGTLKTLQFIIDSLEYSKQAKERNNQQLILQLQLYDQKIQASLDEIELAKINSSKQAVFRNYILIISIALVFIILGLVYQYRNSNKQRLALTEQNKKITEQHTIIEESLQEKNLLIKEIHHRVKNNLQMVSSLLNLQSGMVDDENARFVLEEARHRIGSLAIIHQQLYGKSDFSYLRIDEYVVHLLEHLESAYRNSDKQIKTEISCEPLELHIDTAIPLGIIINEIITNSYKHAFKGRTEGCIQLSLKKENSFFKLIIKDDGVGLPSDFEEQKKHSLGQELIGLLTEQIDATLAIQSELGSGTSYTIKWS